MSFTLLSYLNPYMNMYFQSTEGPNNHIKKEKRKKKKASMPNIIWDHEVGGNYDIYLGYYNAWGT